MDKIEVTQRARDFAADYLEKNGQITSRSAEDIRAGEWDETRHVVEVARFERDILATRTDAAPVAWMHRNSEGHTCVQFVQGLMDLDHWTETPLYTHPPATDVAALVEAAKALVDHCWETEKALTEKGYRMDYCGESVPLCNTRQALAPFTKGQPHD